VISKDGLKVSPEKVRAIQEMPAPTDVAGVKRVLGLVQYLTPLEHLSDATVVLLVVFTPYKNIVDYTFYTR
jgi:hypothetical protein